MIGLVESGATKAHWVFLEGGNVVYETYTVGLNPNSVPFEKMNAAFVGVKETIQSMLRFYNEKGIVVDTLSGFKVNNSLVTAEEAFFIKKAVSVIITFCGDNYQSELASLDIPYREFVSNFGVGLRVNDEGYAVFNIDLPEFEIVPALCFDESGEIPLGHGEPCVH